MFVDTLQRDPLFTSLQTQPGKNFIQTGFNEF